MDIRTTLIHATLPLALVALGAVASGELRAQAAASPPTATPLPAPAAPAAKREVTDATCGEYLDLVEEVAAESKNTAADAPHDAQDDLVSVMLWLHGYLSGKLGIDGEKRPLTREWLSENVGVLAKACAVDESRRVVDVVDGLQ